MKINRQEQRGQRDFLPLVYHFPVADASRRKQRRMSMEMSQTIRWRFQ